MRRQEHQIDRFHIRLKSNRQSLVAQHQQQLSYLLHTAGFKEQLESLLDRCTPSGDFVEVQALKIKLKCSDGARLGEMLLAELATNLQQSITGRNDGGVVKFTKEAFRMKVMEEFLLYGIAYRPGALPLLQELLPQIRDMHKGPGIDPGIARIIYQLLETASVATKRIYFLVGEEGMRLIFFSRFGFMPFDTKIDGALQGAKQDLQAVLNRANESTADYWTAAFSSMSNPTRELNPGGVVRPGEPGKPGSLPLGEQTSIKATPESHRDFRTTPTDASNLPATIPIANAGLILLWAICNKLFRECGYVEDRKFIDVGRQQLAILLLQYLASGTTTVEEYDLPLNKMLCAWPLHEPVNVELFPEPQALLAAQTALEEFISSWRGEKKYSAAWFRAAFLQREGEVSFRSDGNIQLVVQRKTEDVLISPMTVIRLPWMTNLIFVQW